MPKRIIYQNSNGGVSIVAPVAGLDLGDADMLAHVVDRSVPNGVAHEVVATADIPTERTFRGAWRKNGKNVRTDMPAAKEIAHEKRRAARDEQMKPLDVKATIPAEAAKAESDRAKVRAANAKTQTDIDGAKSESALLVIIQ